jgi:hypothetical protein
MSLSAALPGPAEVYYDTLQYNEGARIDVPSKSFSIDL